MIPATPTALTENVLRRPAALLWVEELLEEVLVGVPEADCPVALEPDPDPVAEPPLEPPVSVTFELTQEIEVPATTVTMSE